MKILVIDNYDSFVYNLVQYLGELGAEPIVRRNDSQELEKIEAEGIVISPGPGSVENPRDIGACLEIIRNSNKPVLGVCLGHQAIAYAFGGSVRRSNEIMHGKASEITHNVRGIFKGVKNPLKVMRYHSLVPGEVPEEIEVTARTADGEIFGLQHKKRPMFGVQFHPESIGTEDGKKIVKNFLEACR